jgi:hypothetical protein
MLVRFLLDKICQAHTYLENKEELFKNVVILVKSNLSGSDQSIGRSSR